jgi:hypothetical protein
MTLSKRRCTSEIVLGLWGRCKLTSELSTLDSSELMSPQAMNVCTSDGSRNLYNISSCET